MPSITPKLVTCTDRACDEKASNCQQGGRASNPETNSNCLHDILKKRRGTNSTERHPSSLRTIY